MLFFLNLLVTLVTLHVFRLQCSKTCDTGSKTRQVLCLSGETVARRVDDAQCSAHTRPVSRKDCKIEDCKTILFHFDGEGENYWRYSLWTPVRFNTSIMLLLLLLLSVCLFVCLVGCYILSICCCFLCCYLPLFSYVTCCCDHCCCFCCYYITGVLFFKFELSSASETGLSL